MKHDLIFSVAKVKTGSSDDYHFSIKTNLGRRDGIFLPKGVMPEENTDEYEDVFNRTKFTIECILSSASNTLLSRYLTYKFIFSDKYLIEGTAYSEMLEKKEFIQEFIVPMDQRECELFLRATPGCF